mmetsp:Transcript_79939/g.222723  ORF Transcript_79939/g.222723 Transcript_79939/m.222723 type:complete len:221 (-) Transcript_79939:501-1163(-)
MMNSGTKTRRPNARAVTVGPCSMRNIRNLGAMRPTTSRSWNVAINDVTCPAGNQREVTPGKTANVAANTRNTVRAWGHASRRRISTEDLLRGSVRRRVPSEESAKLPDVTPFCGASRSRRLSGTSSVVAAWCDSKTLAASSNFSRTCTFFLTFLSQSGTPSIMKKLEEMRPKAVLIFELTWIRSTRMPTIPQKTPATPWPTIKVWVRQGEIAPAIPKAAL